MIYRSDKYLNCLLLHVHCFMPELYVYYLIWTKCIHNLCVHSYMRIRCSFYNVYGSVSDSFQKIGNGVATRVSLESSINPVASFINLVTRFLIGKTPYRVASNRRYPTLTPKTTTNISYIYF